MMDGDVEGQERGTSGSAVSEWRRNMWAVGLGELLAIAGFNAAMPFLPYYVQELGITAPGQVEVWTGVLASANAWMMAMMSPVWGVLADRMGRKLMLTRALFGGAALVGGMALVSNVQQLLGLRFAQGAVTGTVAAAYTLVSAGTPPRERPYALSVVQLGVYLGASLGPTLGGLAADLWGYRACFAATGLFLAAGGIVVSLLVREDRPAHEEGDDSTVQGLRAIAALPAVLVVLSIRFLFSAALRVATPLLPLLVQSLAPNATKVASLTGLIDSVYMVTTGLGALLAGRFGREIGPRRLLFVCLVMAGALFLPQALAKSLATLWIARALCGFAMGGIIGTLGAELAAAAPPGRQGTVFGLDSTVHSVGNALGALLGGALAASRGLPLAFVTTAIGLLGAAVLVAAGSRTAGATQSWLREP